MFFTTTDERNPEIAALADGGFMLVYQSDSTDNDIAYETFNAAGARQNGGYIIDDASGGAVPNRPAVASATATSAMTAYVVSNTNGSEDVFVRAYNPDSNTLLAQQLKLAGFAAFDENIGGIGLTRLSNNNFALAIGNRNAGDDTVVLSILDAAGATLHTGTISPGVEIGAVQCVGLAGGNVAITFENLTSGTIVLAVYSSSATVVDSPAQVSFITGSQNEPSVCALADGGFMVVWDDDSNSDIRGLRFDAAGTKIGSEFIIDTNGSQTQPRAVGLADGRFQVTWLEDNNIRSDIYDPRDTVNVPEVYAGNEWQIGTVNADTFTATADANIIHGWEGVDTITDGVGQDSIYGDADNDTIIVASSISTDFFDGGSGVDTIDWSIVSEVDVIFDLQAGTATDSTALVEQMLSFENLNGTANRDIILGTSFANILNGNGGNDTIEGRGGADQINGGAGTDFASYLNAATGVTARLDFAGLNTGDAAGDTYVSVEGLNGSEFGDFLVGDTGFNNLAGQGGDDYLAGVGSNDTIRGGNGNDQFWGGEGADRLEGGNGYDIARYDFAASGVVARLDGGANAGEAAGDIFVNVEALYGSAFGDYLIGDNSNNVLVGLDGGDLLYGLGGDDLLLGGGGIDAFAFNTTNFGTDAVIDFATTAAAGANHDYVDFRGIPALSSFSITQVGADTHVITNHGTVILQGITASTLVEGDFLF